MCSLYLIKSVYLIVETFKFYLISKIKQKAIASRHTQIFIYNLEIRLVGSTLLHLEKFSFYTDSDQFESFARQRECCRFRCIFYIVSKTT